MLLASALALVAAVTADTGKKKLDSRPLPRQWWWDSDAGDVGAFRPRVEDLVPSP